MNKPLLRACIVEMLGTFAVVLFAAGIVCVNQLTVPDKPAVDGAAAEKQQAATSTLFNNQPGLVGIALTQGLVLAAALVLTMHVSGGYLNPAITLMLWVFNRMPSARAAWLIVAQLLGAVLAGAVLRWTFDDNVLSAARMGSPHLNHLVYDAPADFFRLMAGTVIEFILTFFLVFAIFGTMRDKGQWRQLDEEGSFPGDNLDEPARSIDARLAALIAGLTLTACVLFAFPLTGAAANPARWFGPVLWEAALPRGSGPPSSPFADTFVYTGGPVAAALAAGLLFFKLLPPSAAEKTAIAEGRSRKRG
jgi:glycerol uptake facilitator-like aquaporin